LIIFIEVFLKCWMIWNSLNTQYTCIHTFHLDWQLWEETAFFHCLNKVDCFSESASWWTEHEITRLATYYCIINY
jgi:hypothetical protein